MQRMPINAAGLLRSLPPHLQQVLGTSSLLPRIGGAVFMHALHENGAKATVAGAAAAQGTAAAAAPADATAVVATAKPAAVEGGPVSAAAAANGNLQPAKPGQASLSPRAGAAIAAGSGAVTPVGDGSMRNGLMYKQGSVGAALVAEALRQEVAQQLAAAAATAAAGGGSGLVSARPRSRQPSPLPGARARSGSRQSMTSPEGAVLPAPPPVSAASPFAAPDAGAAQQQEPGAQQPPQPPLHLFPGLPRSRSDAAASMSSTPTLRPIVALPPPPPRRSTNLSQRVQEQVGCPLGAVLRGHVCGEFAGPASAQLTPLHAGQAIAAG